MRSRIAATSIPGYASGWCGHGFRIPFAAILLTHYTVDISLWRSVFCFQFGFVESTVVVNVSKSFVTIFILSLAFFFHLCQKLSQKFSKLFKTFKDFTLCWLFVMLRLYWVWNNVAFAGDYQNTGWCYKTYRCCKCNATELVTNATSIGAAKKFYCDSWRLQCLSAGCRRYCRLRCVSFSPPLWFFSVLTVTSSRKAATTQCKRNITK